MTRRILVETQFHGCNPGIIATSDGVVMVDMPQKPSDAIRWLEAASRIGAIRYIVLTEPHVDHCTTGYLFAAPIIAHRHTRESLTKDMLGVPMETFFRDYARAIDLDGSALLDGYSLKLPTITIDGEATLHLGDCRIELLHMPGHTAGEIAVHIPEERVVFTGDNVFCRVQTWLQDADPRAWLTSLQRLAQLDVDVLVPGHGDVCNRLYLGEQASFLEEWMEAVLGAVSQGLSKEEAQERISFLSRYPMDVGTSGMGEWLQKLNVARLYEVLTQA